MDNKESDETKIGENLKQVMATAQDGLTECEKPIFNARQRDLLRKSWQRAHPTGSDSAGARIFRKIFTTEPAIARIFGLQGVAAQDLAYNPQFQPHADRFTKTLTFLISNLDNKALISQRAQTLGTYHVKFESCGFKTMYWDVFAEAMTECAIDWEVGMRCREAMHAWRLLVVFFIEEMRKGYQQQRRSSIQSVLLYNGDSSASVDID